MKLTKGYEADMSYNQAVIDSVMLLLKIHSLLSNNVEMSLKALLKVAI